MKIVVIGGTGRIGSMVVENLARLGHQALAAAPNTGVDTISGDGLAEALAGAQVVIDVSNSPSFEAAAAMAFFQTSSRNLLAAERVAGVGHHVALSVVGTDRLPTSGYFRAKLAQEELIKATPVPYTILRSTQFFPFIEGIISSGAVGDEIHVSSAMVQPVAAEEVADALTEIALRPPINATIEIAGPTALRLDAFAEAYLSAKGDPRRVIADARTPYFGAILDDRSLTPGAAPRIGAVTYEDWMRDCIAPD